MIGALGTLARPILSALDPEVAHRLTIAALRLLPPPADRREDPRLAVDALGLTFANPLGMAAGFDKNAEVPDALVGIGFGFAEIGTVTPKPQAGNPRPRIFRLPDSGGLVNRLGFNNEGHDAVHGRLAARAARRSIIGVNIGANRDTVDLAADYVCGVESFADVASYFTVNVSSPNTPGLRDLQRPAELDGLLARVLAARDRIAERHGFRPVLIKIAPDLTLAELDAVVAVARSRRIDGMIVANTTVGRPPGLAGPAAAQAGGLSGRPLFALSTKILAETFLRTDGQFPLIGVGGIDGAAAAYAKIEAGATFVQLYTALVFKGPALIGEIKRGIVARLAQDGYAHLSDAVGTKASAWVSGNVPATSLR